MADDRVLQGLKVVEIGQYVAAPLAATIFADHGAQVVKVERPGGEPLRSDPARFAAWNRGKRTVELDLATEAGHREALGLLDEADLLVENLRPGAMERLGLGPAVLRATRPGLVTCSISAWGSTGPSRDEPGWEPLVHARAGAQQGLFTGDDPIWLPFPMASVAAALLAVLGAGAALVKRASTGYGQHVETSLLDGLLFLNAAPIFHREGHRPRIVRQTKSPILRVFETADGRSVMVNLSGTERWHELCRLLDMDDGGLDYSSPEGLAKLSDREWNKVVLQRVIDGFAGRTADEWEAALLQQPAAVAKCNTLAEWLAHDQARIEELVVGTLVGPPVRIGMVRGERRSGRRHGSEQGALGGHRIVDLSSFWAGPLAARLLAELGADVVKVEPPGGEGGFQLMPVLPNIYVDGNRSKRGLVLDLKAAGDRARLLDLVAASDVVVENAMAGAWERLGLDEAQLRAVNPSLVYARAKGFGVAGPLGDAAQFRLRGPGGDGHGDGPGRRGPAGARQLHGQRLRDRAAAGGRDRAGPAGSGPGGSGDDGGGLVGLDGDRVPVRGRGVARVPRVGAGPGGRRPPGAGSGVPAVSSQGRVGDRVLRDGGAADGAGSGADWDGDGGDNTGGVPARGPDVLAEVAGLLAAEEMLSLLRSAGVPAALSVHPSAVPDDPQVVARDLLRHYRHPAAGRFVQVGIPLSLSVDAPAVKGPAPTPAPVRRRAKPAGAGAGAGAR